MVVIVVVVAVFLVLFLVFIVYLHNHPRVLIVAPPDTLPPLATTFVKCAGGNLFEYKKNSTKALLCPVGAHPAYNMKPSPIDPAPWCVSYGTESDYERWAAMERNYRNLYKHIKYKVGLSDNDRISRGYIYKTTPGAIIETSPCPI